MPPAWGHPVAMLIAFLCGSLPTAYLMGRARGIDIRQHGSGNVGATNAFRVLGKSWGIVCLVIDALKGALPVLLSARMLHLSRFDLALWLIAVAAVAGHMFSPFVGFRGGKGVATTLGVMLALVPVPMLLTAVVGIAIIWKTGFVSLGSVTCSLLLPILVLVLDWPARPWIPFVATALLGLAIVWKHRANIRRLKAGTEKKFFDKPTSEESKG